MTAAFEVLSAFEVNSAEWHEQRRRTVGASDVAAILGLSPWQTPLGIYRQKQGVPNQIDPDLAWFGHALEPVIADWVQAKHPDIGEVAPGGSFRSTRWPWLSAAPDRFVFDPKGVEPTVPLELKSSSAFSKATWEAGVPLYYAAQVQQQLAVLDAPHGWLAVLHGGNSPDLYRIDRDDEFIDEHLILRTRTFWEDHVLAKVEPEPTTTAEAVSIWSGDTSYGAIEADDALYRMWQEFMFARESRRIAESESDRLALEIQKQLGEATELRRGGQLLATWKPRAGARRLDTKQLRTDHPDLADAYTIHGDPTRVFQAKPQAEANA